MSKKLKYIYSLLLRDLLVIRLHRYEKDEDISCEKWKTQIIHSDYLCKNSICILTVAKSSHR